MDRRAFIRTAPACLLLVPAMARAQPAAKVFRIGFLTNFTPLAELEAGVSSSNPEVVAFAEGLRALGWHEGRNIRMAWRSAEGQLARHPRIVDELIRTPVDVIVAFSEGVDAAAAATKTIPIVMGGYYYPVERGLVQSMARPGRNVTGLVYSADTSNVPKALSLLKESSPSISRVALISRASGAFADRTPDPKSQPQLAAAAAALGIDLFRLTFGDPRTIGAVLESAVRQGANAVLLDGNFSLFQHGNQKLIEQAAVRHRLPISHGWLPAVASGGLMAHGSDNLARWRRLPYYVDRILKGAKAADLPIEQLGNPELHINLRAAKAIGLEIPRSLLLQADKVYE